MSENEALAVLEPPPEDSAKSTGLYGRDVQHGVSRRPLSMAWISDELLAETIDVWSDAYQRPVDEHEAVEILMNVKRLGEVLLQARREVDST